VFDKDISDMKKRISFVIVFLFLCVGMGFFFRDEQHALKTDQELHDLLEKIVQNGGGIGVASNDLLHNFSNALH